MLVFEQQFAQHVLLDVFMYEGFVYILIGGLYMKICVPPCIPTVKKCQESQIPV